MADTYKLFCANEQEETAHTIDVDDNAEIGLTCKCGRFVKLPAGTDAAGIEAYAEAHKESNAGQISKEAIEKKKAEIIKALK